jgi:hypothetical protein
VVTSTLALPVAASILMRLESLHATNTAPATPTICSHPCGVAILARICPVEGSIRITVRVERVHTDPDPTANGCAPATAGFAGNTSAIWATTSPVREICKRELPLRAHRDPKPETSTDGSGTAALRAVGDGEGVAEVGVGVDGCGCAEVAGGDDALEHAASSTAIDARQVAVLIRCNDRAMDRDMSGMSSIPAVDEERQVIRRPARRRTPCMACCAMGG